jgi:hypothetical protein
MAVSDAETCSSKYIVFVHINMVLYISTWGPLIVAQWLRYCATNRKVAGSIQDGVIGIFH